jgi:RNA polymerase subunit RPABC4/transcription elongation factor Spt4
MAGALLIAYVVVLWLGTMVWVYRDIRQRTHDDLTTWLSLALAFVFSLPGLILYLILRPRETLVESYERRLEAEALMNDMPERRTCPRCARPIKEDFLLCPNCRSVLRENCSNCGKMLELTWAACPYCGAPGPQPVMTSTPVMSPTSYAAGPPPMPQPATTNPGSPTSGQPPA